MNSLIRRVQFVWYQWNGTATRFPRVKLCCAGGACRRCSRLSWAAAVPISHRQEGPGSWVICWDRRAVPVPTCEGATGLCVTTVPPTPSRSPSKRCWCGPVRHCGCRVSPMDRLRMPPCRRWFVLRAVRKHGLAGSTACVAHRRCVYFASMALF